MRIHWLSHSGFLVETPSAALVFDLFEDPAGVLDAFFQRRRLGSGAVQPVYFFVSHAHADHCSPVVLDYAAQPGVTVVLERQAALSLAEQRQRHLRIPDGALVHVRPRMSISLPVDGSPILRVETFESTDQGVSFLVRIDGRTLFHAGDLNDWYWEEESTEYQLVADEAAFDRIVEDIRAAVAPLDSPLDAAFLPLDPRLGRHATRGPLRFLSRIRTRQLVPMHLPVGTGLPDALSREAGPSVRVVTLAGPGSTAELD